MSQVIQNVGPGAVYAGLPTPSSLQGIIPAYVYQQYADDDNIQAIFMAYNAMAQSYLGWFNATPLAIYANSSITGPLLDWVLTNLYGIPRPVLATFTEQISGALSTQPMNTLAVNVQNVAISGTATLATDDIYKRVATWWLYKGDGKQMSIPWVKRRVARFLYGVDGTDISYPMGAGLQPSVAISYGSSIGALNTFPLGAEPVNGNESTKPGFITITAPPPSISPVSKILAQLVDEGLLGLPFQNPFTVAFATVNTNFGSGLSNDGGVAVLTSPPGGYPISPIGLTPGEIYSNGGVVCVAGTTSPSPYATPVYALSTTAASLLALGGANLPLSNPEIGSGRLWNNGGVVSVA
jgi:hypothetical protein